MPELPEVETTLRGIAPHITGKTIVRTTVRQAKLRHPVPPDLDGTLNGETVLRCTRRAKYLLVHLPQGILLIHLGMSGSLRIFTSGNAPDAGKHDHVEIEFSGNIYANESLFAAGIAPNRPAMQISRKEAAALVHHIRETLRRAIEKGGSTLRDFVDSEGKSGYFQQEYKVYGRQGQPCLQCGGGIEKTVIGQRGTFYCPNCQH